MSISKASTSTLVNNLSKNDTFIGQSGVSSYTVQYLVIAGGGGGGTADDGGGGGGAGGYRCSVPGENSGGGATAETPLSIKSGSILNVIVGAGGNAVYGIGSGNSYSCRGLGAGKGGFGNPSQFGPIISRGGGGGGGIAGSSYRQIGGDGGSGGGGGQRSTSAGGSGTSGQGYSGGSTGNSNDGGGGGGGAGSSGTNSNNNVGGNGGSGVASSITGTAVTRGGGGAGGGGSGNGSAGSGGGGAAGPTTGADGSPGTDGTGGGGGASNSHTQLSGRGGDGIVIFRYSDTLPDVTVSAGLTYTKTNISNFKVFSFTGGSGTVTFI